MAADIKALEAANPMVQTAAKTALTQAMSSPPEAQPRAGKGFPPATDRQSLERLAERLQDYVQSMDREVQFRVDETSGYTVIKVIDPATQKVIRQIPAEVTLRLARHLDNGGQGMLFADEA